MNTLDGPRAVGGLVLASLLVGCGAVAPALEAADEIAVGVPSASPTATATPESPPAMLDPVLDIGPPETVTAPEPSPTIWPSPPPTIAPSPSPPSAPPSPPSPSPSPTGTAGPRQVHVQDWTPFATVGGIVLRHPSARVERVGFHEAGHKGARQMDVAATAVAPLTLESRDRGTGSRSAADIVVDPAVEIRAPVSGTVKRAGTYVLYCDHRDDYVVIDPDDRPGWEVKLLHIDGVAVSAGDRVEAGVTVLAPRPTLLPFRSQVDDHTAEPSWPHVHVEVVDPTIPNPPGPGC